MGSISKFMLDWAFKFYVPRDPLRFKGGFHVWMIFEYIFAFAWSLGVTPVAGLNQSLTSSPCAQKFIYSRTILYATTILDYSNATLHAIHALSRPAPPFRKPKIYPCTRYSPQQITSMLALSLTAVSHSARNREGSIARLRTCFPWRFLG